MQCRRSSPTPPLHTPIYAHSLICQLFLVWRFFKVSKSYIIAALLCLSPLGAVSRDSDLIHFCQVLIFMLILMPSMLLHIPLQWISAVYATVALVVYTSLQDRLRVVASESPLARHEVRMFVCTRV